MTAPPTEYTLDWMRPGDRDRLVFPLSPRALVDLINDAIWSERWGDAIAISDEALKAFQLAQRNTTRGTYEREDADRDYHQARGRWEITLTLWHAMNSKAEREAQAKIERKRKAADRKFYKGLGLTPRKANAR